MRTKLFSLLGFVFVVLISAPTFGTDGIRQESTPGEAEFTVLGMCGMCKDRIERAAYGVRGVRFARWDQDKQLLSVRYRPSRTNQEEIERAVAKVGHDTENFLTDEETYKNLHHCCVYPRDPEMLKNNKVHNQP